MNFVGSFLQYAGLGAEVILLGLLLRGPLRSYKILFTYCFLQLASALLEVWIINQYGTRSRIFSNTYWICEVLIDLTLFVLVTTLTYRVLGDNPHKGWVARLLFSVAVLVVVLPPVIYHDRRLFSTSWFNGVSQFLNFGVALMTFGLWAAVVNKRTRDLQLLTVASGLGLLVTGSSVSFGLRQFTASGSTSQELANIFGQLSFLFGVLVWCWVFWRQPTEFSS
jgi:hypothetical protein